MEKGRRIWTKKTIVPRRDVDLRGLETLHVMLNLSDPADGVGPAGCLHAARRKEGKLLALSLHPQMRR